MAKKKPAKKELSQDNIKSLLSLLELLKSQVQQPAKPTEIEPKKRGRPKKAPVVPSEASSPTQPIDDSDDDEEIVLTGSPNKIKKSRRTLTTEEEVAKKSGRKPKTVMSRKPLTIPRGGRPNLFESMPEYNAFKDESVPKRKVVRQKKAKQEKVEVECTSCGDIFLLYPSQVPDTEFYKCDECILNRKSNDD